MSSKKILIVEDEAIVALTLEQTLTDLGYTVCNRIDRGEDVLAAVKKCSPNLILMDIMLKGEMTGVDAANLVKNEFKIPIIYLTAYSNEEIFKKAKITDPAGYIIKPFNERELQINIDIALYKHEAENKIIASEKKFRNLAESIPQIVFECDKKGNVTFLNEVGFQLFRYSTNTFNRGVNFLNWFLPKDTKNINNNLELFANTLKINQGIEYKLTQAENNTFDAQLYVNPIITNAKFNGLRGVIIDVSDKKKKESVQKLIDNVSQKALDKNITKIEILDFTFKALKQIFQFDELYIGEYNKKEEEINFFYIKRNSQFENPIIRKSGNGLSEYVIKNDKKLKLNEEESYLFHKSNNLNFYGKIAKSWMGVPMHDTKEVCGVFALQSFSNSNAFSYQDLESLQQIVNHLGLVIEKINTQLENNKLSEAVKNTHDLVVITDAEGKINYANNAFLNFSSAS